MPAKKQAKKPAKTAAKKAAKKPAMEAPFTTNDAAAAYRHFLSAAEALPANNAPVRSGDTAIARRNIERGVKAITPHLETISTRLPTISVKALLELPALALALIHADGRVPAAASTRAIDTALARVSPLRELTLTYLEIAAALKLVPEGRVRAIRKGKGKLDNARDCVDIAGTFHDFEGALTGKHPFTQDHLKELATTGTWLVERITPGGTIKSPSARDPAALLRDRFWKLLEEGHNDLRTAGVALFGIKNVDDYVPPLLSRYSAPTEKVAEPAAKPADTPP
jgi:hypothetical protein